MGGNERKNCQQQTQLTRRVHLRRSTETTTTNHDQQRKKCTTRQRRRGRIMHPLPTEATRNKESTSRTHAPNTHGSETNTSRSRARCTYLQDLPPSPLPPSPPRPSFPPAKSKKETHHRPPSLPPKKRPKRYQHHINAMSDFTIHRPRSRSPPPLHPEAPAGRGPS